MSIIRMPIKSGTSLHLNGIGRTYTYIIGSIMFIWIIIRPTETKKIKKNNDNFFLWQLEKRSDVCIWHWQLLPAFVCIFMLSFCSVPIIISEILVQYFAIMHLYHAGIDSKNQRYNTFECRFRERSRGEGLHKFAIKLKICTLIPNSSCINTLIFRQIAAHSRGWYPKKMFLQKHISVGCLSTDT